jgi:hypothetical protein
VPAPIGCERLDGDGPAILEAQRLDAGQRIAFAFNARIVRPVAEIVADAGEVRFGNERTCALPARGTVVPTPVLAPPRVELLPFRRRVECEMELRNDGWGDARDVTVRIVLPPALKIAANTVAVDGVLLECRAKRNRKAEPAFAHAVRLDDGCTVVIGTIPARERARITLSAAHPAGWNGGTIGVRAGEHTVEAPFVPEHVRDVRLRLVDAPRAIAPGETTRLMAQIVNAGDLVEKLQLSAFGCGIAPSAPVRLRSLAVGAKITVPLEICFNPEDEESDKISVTAIVSDAEEASIVPAGPVARGERARQSVDVVVRGRSARSECEEGIAIASGGAEERRLGARAGLRAVLCAPDDVPAGAAFKVRIEIDTRDAVEELAVRVPALAGATYVAGSTTLDGHGVLDRCGRSPLDDGGLTLRGVPAGARLVVAWSCLADPFAHDRTVTIDATIGVNGEPDAIEPAMVRIQAGSVFPLRPVGLRYHVDACTVAPVSEATNAAVPYNSEPMARAAQELRVPELSSPAPSAPVASTSVTFAVSWDAARLAECARFLEGVSVRGLVSHVLTLRALFPDMVAPHDPLVEAALDDVRTALHDVFDRLFVKLRIPGFYVAADDLEDTFLRSALIALFAQLPEGAVSGARVAALPDAAYGAPTIFRTLAALLPRSAELHDSHDALLGEAVSRYVAAVDDALARFENVPLELFEDALTRGSDRALDEARAEMLEALHARIAPAAAAC